MIGTGKESPLLIERLEILICAILWSSLSAIAVILQLSLQRERRKRSRDTLICLIIKRKKYLKSISTYNEVSMLLHPAQYMHVSVCMSVCLSACLDLPVSVYQSILFTCTCLCLLVYLLVSTCLSVSVCQSVCLSVCLYKWCNWHICY